MVKIINITKDMVKTIGNYSVLMYDGSPIKVVKNSKIGYGIEVDYRVLNSNTINVYKPLSDEVEATLYLDRDD